MLLNGALQIEETATQFPQFALLDSVTPDNNISEIAVALRLPVSLVCPRPNC
jgi:hypothetical protein